MAVLRDKMIERIREEGLESYEEDILAGLVAGFELGMAEAPEGSLAVGASKSGGLPALPSGTPWPENDGRPLHFLAQIDLADVPTNHVTDGEFPSSGLLSFWHDTQAFRGHTDVRIDSPGVFRVTLFDGQLEPRPFPVYEPADAQWGAPFKPFSERSIVVVPTLMITEDAEQALQRKTDDEEDDELVEMLFEICTPETHQLFGSQLLCQVDGRKGCAARAAGFDPYHPTPEQAAEIKARMRDWRVLASFDSDDVWTWGDGESLTYWVDRDDLARGVFSRVLGTLDG